jgi:hypothetical protein
MLARSALCLSFLLTCHAEVPVTPQEIISQVGQHWDQDGWQLPGSQKYMRNMDDTGWQNRILAMQKLVQLGKQSVTPLLEILKNGPTGMRIFAAQTLGYLPGVPAAQMIDAAANDKHPAVRLYAVDSLGMSGAKDLKQILEPLLPKEKKGDVKKHIAYAIEREGTPVSPAVVERLKKWNPQTLNSAVIGRPAPDFEMPTFNGEMVRLSDFKGKKAVVLVFIYGDT